MRIALITILLLGLIALTVYRPTPPTVAKPPARATVAQLPAPGQDVLESYRRELELLYGDLPRLNPQALDFFYQSMRSDGDLSRRQRLELLLEQLEHFEPGSDEWVATLYTLASEVPLERLDELLDLYRNSSEESSRDLLLQVMRVALQEPMIGSLASNYPQGPDALFLLARRQTKAFQTFLVEEGLQQTDPGLFADVLWTRAMMMPADQGLEIVAESFHTADDPVLATHLARIYNDLLFEDATLTPLLLERAIGRVQVADGPMAVALATDWRQRLARGDLEDFPQHARELRVWLGNFESATP